MTRSARPRRSELPDPTPWLLGSASPSVRLRTLRDLLGRPPRDPAVRAAEAEVRDGPEVAAIFARMRPDGYWLQRSSNGRWVGDGVEYGSFATTHFVLAELSELGLDRSDPRVERAASRYLDLVTAEGDFWRHMSCLAGMNVRTFVRLGFRGDPRLERAIDLLARTDRHDGGYLCDLHARDRIRRPVASCVRGAAKALVAFAELPDHHGTPRCRALVAYFLRREGLFRTRALAVPAVKEATQTVFPFSWRCGLLDVLLGLSALGHGDRPELARAWALLESKRDLDGKYRLDWTPSQSLLRAGARGAPSGWVTFYALLAWKLRRERPRAAPPELPAGALTRAPPPRTPASTRARPRRAGRARSRRGSP